VKRQSFLVVSLIFLIILLVVLSETVPGFADLVFWRYETEKILSDNQGKIQHIVFQIPGSSLIKNHYFWSVSLNYFRSILEELNSNVEITIITESQSCSERLPEIIKDKWNIHNTVRILLIPESSEKLSPWGQDGYVIVKNKDEKITLIVPTSERYSAVSRALSEGYPHMTSIVSDLDFDGGNIVSNDRNVFIGYSLIEENDRLGLSEQEIIQKLEGMFGKNVVIIGDKNHGAPFAHIDMYLTPIGKKTLLLGDSRLAVDLLLKTDDPLILDSLIFKKQIELNLSEDIFGALERAKDKLENQGFRVIRIPYFGVTYSTQILRGKFAHFITYNNVLIEEKGKEKVVYLPIYGVESLDKKAIEIYESLGFKVKEVEVGMGITKFGGSIRCLSKIVERN